MADATPGVSASASPENKTTHEIRQEMQETRESITEKVAALENQVIGTIQTAANTMTNTVDAVKEVVTSAPSAVSDTVKQTMDAVKQTVQDTVGSFSISGCVRKNPWAALGTSAFAGFLAGYRGGAGAVTPAEPHRREPAAMPVASQSSGLISGLYDMAGHELRELAEHALSSFLQSLKRSVGDRVPEVVDSAVNRVAQHLQDGTRLKTSTGM